MANYGAKVSKTGQDVKTATGQNLILTSERNCLKVKAPASMTVTSSGGSGTNSVSHSLGFRPVVVAFVAYSGAYHPIPILLSGGETATFKVTTSSFQVYLNGFPNGSYTVYYLLSETESAI